MNTIAILISTYKRPDLLANLLESLHANNAESFDIIVVDNDVEQSARKAVTASAVEVTYIPEPKPGIAAARNRALDSIRANHEWVVFVDDDEWVCTDWLKKLTKTQLEYNADVVSGPVSPVLPAQASRWVRAGRFHERPVAQTGGRTRWPATNNTLVRVSTFNGSKRHRFSEEFSLTGGSDTEFFWRLEQDGASFIWCNEAVVYEDVPAARLTSSWLWRRGRRLGNVSARMLILKGRSRWMVFAFGVGRLVLAPFLTIFALCRHQAWGAAAMNLPKAIGMIEVVTRNSYVEEYKRS